MRKEYNKLVRDRIPEIISADGEQPITRILDTAEFIQALQTKLHEETEETVNAKDAPELTKEITDVLEVLRALAEVNAISWEEVERVREERALKRGAFKERIFLEATETK